MAEDVYRHDRRDAAPGPAVAQGAVPACSNLAEVGAKAPAVQAKMIRMTVDEVRHGAGMDDRVRRGDEGQRRTQDLVAIADPERVQDHLQGRGAADDGHGLARPAGPGKCLLEDAHVTPGVGDEALRHGFVDQPPFALREFRFVQLIRPAARRQKALKDLHDLRGGGRCLGDRVHSVYPPTRYRARFSALRNHSIVSVRPRRKPS